MERECSRRILITIFVALLAVNVGIFTYVNTRPIYWQNAEIAFHHFFWSVDDINTYTLHTGLRRGDLIKPFMSTLVDGSFRTRQFSYFVEMLSFKLWQLFELGTVRDGSLIVIHIINALFVFFLVKRLTGNAIAALLGCILFVNSGVGLATLLFPFRNAKLLVMTLLLGNWLIIARTQEKFVTAKRWQWFCFFAIAWLSFLTDETAFYFFFALMAYILYRDGVAGVMHKRMIKSLMLLACCFFIAVIFSYYLNRYFEPTVNFFVQEDFLKQSGFYMTHFSTIRDTVRALFSYFLRYNFGYWDNTLWGIAAAIGTGTLFIIVLSRRHSHTTYHLVCIFLVAMALKAFFLPHNSGVHRYIMPAGTLFPSLLFFSSYYSYFDAVVMGIVCGLLFKTIVPNNRKSLLLLLCITVINLSSAIHVCERPGDSPLVRHWHGAHASIHQQIIQDVVAVKKVLANNTGKVVYLSFPSENAMIHSPRFLEHKFKAFSVLIPAMYLPSLERGKAVVSLENVKTKGLFVRHQKLVYADIFYDVYSGKSFDLRTIKGMHGSDGLGPTVSTNGIVRTKITSLYPKNIVFFVKGKATFTLTVNEAVFTGEQFYGHSYQMFEYAFDDIPPGLSARIELLISPLYDGEPVYVVGPFALS